MTESASSAKRGGTARSRSRLRAVEILFEAEQRGTTPDEGVRARVPAGCEHMAKHRASGDGVQNLG